MEEVVKLRRDYKGLKRDRTAAGTIRWRVRVEGDVNTLITLPMGSDAPGFDEHNHAARAEKKLAAPKPGSPNKGTLDDMRERFIDWMDEQVVVRNLSKLTLSSRRTGLEQACNVRSPDGDRVGILDPRLRKEAFAHIRDCFGTRTGTAETCLKALRAMYR
mgnify:CR=1 FL=1